MTFIGSIQALRQLMLSKENEIVKVTPEGLTLSNGIANCCVELKSIKGDTFLVQASGKEARELYEEVISMVKIPRLRN